MYFGKSPRIYILTRKENDSGKAFCPKCGKRLKVVPFTKSDKLYQCNCGFKIQKSCVLIERKVMNVPAEIIKVAKVLVASGWKHYSADLVDQIHAQVGMSKAKSIKDIASEIKRKPAILKEIKSQHMSDTDLMDCIRSAQDLY